MTITPSTNLTTITPSYITDASGGVWGLVPTSTAGCQISYNGTIQTATANVTLLLYDNATVYQENSSGNWWAWTSGAWVSIAGDPRTKKPSAAGTQVSTVGPSIVDSALNTWTLMTSAASGMQAAVNAVADTTTANVTLLVYDNSLIYQQNSAGGWWSKTSPSAAWVSTTSPLPDITGMTLSNSSITAGSASGTVVGTVAVTMASGSFTGTLALSGTNASSFKWSGHTLETASSLAAGTYSVTIVATQAAAIGSPYSHTFSITAVSSVTPPTPTTPTPPAQASAAGYSKLVFNDDFTTTTTIATTQEAASGFNWYWSGGGYQGSFNYSTWVSLNTTATAATINNGNSGGGSNASPAGGILTLPTGIFPNANLLTLPGAALNKSGVSLPPLGTGRWQHCYMEAYVQFKPNQNAAEIYTSTGWPAWWTWAAENLGNFGYGGAPFTCADGTEVDFIESYGNAEWGAGDGSGPANETNSTIINHGTGGTNQIMAVSPIDSNWHTYGFLWVPGTITIYYDNVAKGSESLGSSYSLDSQSLFMIWDWPELGDEYRLGSSVAIKFRQILSGIDVAPLLLQLEDHAELWNADDSWVVGKPLLYAVDNIVLRYNRSQGDAYHWDRPPFSILSAAQPIVFDVMRAIPGVHLGKVMISRLRPGEKIDWHIDRMPPMVPLYYQRYQVPLQVMPGVRFMVEDEEVPMVPGTAWWFDNQCMHAVFNDSESDRLSLFTDIRPFQL